MLFLIAVMELRMKKPFSSALARTTKALLFVAAAVAACWSEEGVEATQYTVGSTSGWTLGVDYNTWASQYSFKTGDSLVFSYGGLHSVVQVSENDYNTCSTANALSTGTGGNTVVKLENQQTYYFICGVATHCGSGMQLTVTVGGDSSSPSTETTTPTSKTPPSTTPSSTAMEPSLATSLMSCYGLPTFTTFFTLLLLSGSRTKWLTNHV
ncbi:hypothetical protein L7F22_011644 [Adiantum nelumboides]|nr:hypothetical protein [Adiantum nelumboides]